GRLLADRVEARRESGDFDGARAAIEALDAAADAGDPVLRATAGVVRHRFEVVAGSAETEIIEVETRAAVDVFERAGDERMLAKAWQLLAAVAWFSCRAQRTEEALAHAISHARSADDARTVAQSLDLMLGATLFGPTPV